MRNRLTGVAIALFLSLVTATPQSSNHAAVNEETAGQAAPSPAKPQFFAGSVVEIDPRHVKVSRTLVGRPNETRLFLINADTKINTLAVKVKARVTVRYNRLPEGDTALEIQLRPAVHAGKPR
ncbi:MAG TPA: hypothetical protein VK604_19255 [Bryobacteraceae bacterium]|nr:hypothetical protein [Bryobacteraceae bacterium]